jgi:hypothetical protein
MASDAREFFEAGCGNGSLLLALRQLLPEGLFRGVEPAPGAAEQAQAAGLTVECDLLRPSASVKRASIAIAVNVIEHTPDPLQFICDLGTHGQKLLVICPDGDNANSELLFADHAHSMAPAHLRSLFARAGWRVIAQERAPSDIGPFFATLGVPSKAAMPVDVAQLQSFDSKRDYLNTWAALDEELVARTQHHDVLPCFGMGEAAALLRAYCPRTWARIDVCVVDEPRSATFFEKPVRRIDGSGGPILLGVRPQAQAGLSGRLASGGYESVRWDDLVEC